MVRNQKIMEESMKKLFAILLVVMATVFLYPTGPWAYPEGVPVPAFQKVLDSNPDFQKMGEPFILLAQKCLDAGMVNEEVYGKVWEVEQDGKHYTVIIGYKRGIWVGSFIGCEEDQQCFGIVYKIQEDKYYLTNVTTQEDKEIPKEVACDMTTAFLGNLEILNLK